MSVKCVNCGKEQTRAVCAECVRDVMEEADRERIPLGFDPRRERR